MAYTSINTNNAIIALKRFRLHPSYRESVFSFVVEPLQQQRQHLKHFFIKERSREWKDELLDTFVHKGMRICLQHIHLNQKQWKFWTAITCTINRELVQRHQWKQVRQRRLTILSATTTTESYGISNIHSIRRDQCEQERKTNSTEARNFPTSSHGSYNWFHIHINNMPFSRPTEHFSNLLISLFPWASRLHILLLKNKNSKLQNIYWQHFGSLPLFRSRITMMLIHFTSNWTLF